MWAWAISSYGPTAMGLLSVWLYKPFPFQHIQKKRVGSNPNPSDHHLEKTSARKRSWKLKYPTTGTEAILIEGTTLASKFLRSNGVTLFKAREETVGKADMWFFSPEHPALTDEAQSVLDWAYDKKIKSGSSGEITTSQLLLGIWYEVDSPGQKIMATLGFNEEKAKELESIM